jgi:secreted Zn-dependent insulinase-like peptidase
MFLEEDLPMLVQVEPRATRRTMQVSFPVGEYRQNYDVKPTAYVGNLVGHEGKGSLLSALKAEGLAEGLSAGSGLAWRGGSLFSVTVSLTEKGVAEYQRVLQLLFGYIDMLREKGAQQWLYEEGSKLADLRFRFLQHGEPMGYVTSLSTAMHYYSPDDVLRGPYAMDRYDAGMIDGLVAELRPENALVVMTHEGVETDRVSKWYEVPYSVEHAGTRLLAGECGDCPLPESIRPQQRAPTGVTEFALPAPNAFIPDDVSLVETSWEYSYLPVLLLEQDRQSIWFGQDDEFKVPKGGIFVNFRSPLVAAGPRETAEASMFVSLLKDELNEFTYPALLAGLGFSFYAQPWGISLRITGYNDKQKVLMQELLAPLRRPALDKQRFEDIRDQKVRGLQNRVASRPSSQAMARLNEALLHKQWSDEEMIAAYQAMSVEDVQAFVEQFWADTEAEVLVYGNYKPEMVSEVSIELGKLAGARHGGESTSGDCGDCSIPEAIRPQQRAPTGNRVTRIPARSDLLLPMEIEHDDSVVTWYMQASGISWKDRAMAALSAQIMKSEFFRELRTEQQLGYTASAFVFEKFDVPGLVMLIQSPVANALEVSGAMDKFLDGVESYLDEPTFKRHQKVLIGNVTEPDKNLWERAEYYWQSMANKRYEFDGREKMVDALKKISHEEWENYFNRVFMDRRHSLKVIAPGRWSDLPEADRVFDSAAEIKTSFDYYEFP